MKSLLIMLCLGIGTIAASAQVDLRRTVSVEGEAEVFRTPDRASVSIGVETEGKDVVVIKKENDRRVRAIFDALKKIGIDQKDIMTSDLQIQPQYNWKPEGQRELVKYSMRNVVHITVRDLAKLEGVINASVSEGSNLLDNVSFSMADSKTVRDSLRIAAAKNAKAKAEALAGAVSARVLRVISISENGGYQPPTPMYKAMRSMSAEADMGTPVSAGQLSMRITVNATFEIE
ncbi:MAG: SIMPL domain-containing protein [Candidatus Kapabacteria bacterium]|nr:SIMPL domain-containing protein [Candidatus Kapabacteria bacterium]